MKKFLVLIVLLQLLVTPSFAENIDLSDFSLDELKILQGRIESEIESRDPEDDENPGWLIRSFTDLAPKPKPVESSEDSLNQWFDMGITSIFSSDNEVTYGVGETATTDNISAILINVMESKGNSYNKPKNGNVFVICEFSIQNSTPELLGLSSILCFSAFFNDTAYEISLDALSVSTMLGKFQLDGFVEPGEKRIGVVAYEVLKDWEKLKIQFSPFVWSGDRLTFVANR